MVETPFESEYQLSFQAGIWNRRLILSIVPAGATPWMTEVGVSPPETMRVFGTKQLPVNYHNVAKSGGEGSTYSYDEIPEDHMRVMRERGWVDET